MGQACNSETTVGEEGPQPDAWWWHQQPGLDLMGIAQGLQALSLCPAPSLLE